MTEKGSERPRRKSKSDSLRSRRNQHKPKNTLSKGDDKQVADAMERLVEHLKEQFKLEELGYYLEYVKQMKLRELVDIIKSYDKRKKKDEFGTLRNQNAFIRPDGGILLLRKRRDQAFKRVVLAVEMKRQGTNDKRLAEGKTRQAQGNAIERLGKNLIGIRATLQYEKVTPFVCFGWGIDFDEGSPILDRVLTMNEFYPLNRIFVNKRDGYAPVSLYFRYKQWEADELLEIMKEVAHTSIRVYIY